MPIQPDLLPRARQILLPLVESDDEREALLTDAFYLIPDSRLYHLIKRDGSAMSFTTLCIKKLIDHGCLTGEMHALSQLLSAARMYCGIDKHAEIDALITIANTLCVESTPPSVPDIPAAVPPAVGVQTIATPSSERRPTVFISYSHANDAFAQKLIADLNAAGHVCWIDTSAIKGGADWQRAICEGINLSYAMVVVCTRQALESEYVQDEVQWGRTRRKHIIPVLLEDVTSDDKFFGLHRFQGIRFDQLPYAEALAGLMAALPSAPEGMSDTPPRIISRRESELAYLDRLRFEDFRLEKFELAEYAELGGVAQARTHATEDDWDKLSTGVEMKPELKLLRQDRVEDESHLSTSEAFTDAVSKIIELRRVVVLGDPGAGKTHTLRAIAKPLYTAALNDPKAPIPVMVKLGNWDSAIPFEAFLRTELGELGAHLDDLQSDKRLVLLLDGLNEFPADQRTKKYPQVEAFIKRQPDEVMAVVTCRELDYTLDLRMSRVLIRPLDVLRIRDFANRALKDDAKGETFFWRLAGDEVIRAVWENWEAAGADLRLFFEAPEIPRENPDVLSVTRNSDYWLWREHVRNNVGSLMRLASNPYMLRMLLDIYIQQRGRLPPNRGRLFEDFVNVLLVREKLAAQDEATRTVTLTPEGAQLLDTLKHIAYAMQIQRQADRRGASAGTALALAEVQDVLGSRLSYLAVSANLLLVGDKVRFSHQLLQEYFAARYMDEEIRAGRLKAEVIWKPGTWWERTNWEETIILLAGLYSDDCSRIVEWVNAANPEVAAQCVMRSGAVLADETRARLTTEWLARLTDTRREPNPPARAAVGRGLSLTGWDTRRGVSLDANGLPDIDWVPVAGGEFIYQKNQRLTLPIYRISRYPVTYRQFQAFIDASDGFHDPRWWEGLAASDEHKSAAGDQAFKFSNHPRERVSWYDAIAFCRWLSFRLTDKVYGLDEIGQWPVRLPTEFEWEKAARGMDGRVYPYGNDFDAAKGNTRETGIGQTSAVGIFPGGASPDGVLDMSGNIWQWCLSDYRNPTPDAAGEDLRTDAARVLRGGSWYLDRDRARAASRSNLNPYNRLNYNGFRVVLNPLSLDH